jgi:hypothetical protein
VQRRDVRAMHARTLSLSFSRMRSRMNSQPR